MSRVVVVAPQSLEADLHSAITHLAKITAARHVVLETMRGEGLYANTGGPMSRTRKQQISSSLLGRDSGDIRCPKARTLGLRFDEGESAVEAMEKLLRTVGLDGPEGLRGLFSIARHAHDGACRQRRRRRA